MSNLAKILALTSAEDLAMIKKIVERAAKDKARGDEKIDETQYQNDLIMIHGACCKLDLELLLGASDSIFAHDVFGLIAGFDPEKLKIKHGFTPRCKA